MNELTWQRINKKPIWRVHGSTSPSTPLRPKQHHKPAFDYKSCQSYTAMGEMSTRVVRQATTAKRVLREVYTLTKKE